MTAHWGGRPRNADIVHRLRWASMSNESYYSNIRLLCAEAAGEISNLRIIAGVSLFAAAVLAVAYILR